MGPQYFILGSKAADGYINSDLSDVSSSSAQSHEVMSLPEDNSDDITDMDCSASEGDGRSYSEDSAVATKHLNSKDLTLEKQVVVVTRSGHNLNDQNARIITILYS